MNLRFQLFLCPSSKKRIGIGRIVIMQNAYLRPNSVDKKPHELAGTHICCMVAKIYENYANYLLKLKTSALCSKMYLVINKYK